MFLSSIGKLGSLIFLGGGATLLGCKACEACEKQQCCPETTRVSANNSGGYEYRGSLESGGHIIFGFELRPAQRPSCPFAKR